MAKSRQPRTVKQGQDGSTQLHRWSPIKAVKVWGINNVIGVAPCLACCRHPTRPEWVCKLKIFHVSTITFCWITRSLFLRCLALGVCWGLEHESWRNKSHLTLRHVWNPGPTWASGGHLRPADGRWDIQERWQNLNSLKRGYSWTSRTLYYLLLVTFRFQIRYLWTIQETWDFGFCCCCCCCLLHPGYVG